MILSQTVQIPHLPWAAVSGPQSPNLLSLPPKRRLTLAKVYGLLCACQSVKHSLTQDTPAFMRMFKDFQLVQPVP